MDNPRRKRNPAMATQLAQGVGINEVVAGIGGVAISGLLPDMLIKGTTQQDTLLKLVVAIGGAFGAGYAAKAVAGAAAGKAAVIGGLAATGARAISQLTPLKLAGPAVAPVGLLSSGGLSGQVGRSGVGNYPGPAEKEEFEGVKVY